MSETTPTPNPDHHDTTEHAVAAADPDTSQQRETAQQLVELERQAHPLAARLWAIARDRSEADRRLILDGLRRRLRQGGQTANQGIVVEALRRFASAQEKARSAQPEGQELPRWASGSPSQHRYKLFRRSRPDPRNWPSDSMIAKAFEGTWASSLDAAGLDVAPDVLSRRRLMRSGPFTEREVKALLRRWVEENPDAAEPLTEGSFVIWLEQRSRDPEFAATRCPSRPTLTRIYGTWHQALRSVGALERHPTVAKARRTAKAGGPTWEWALAGVRELDYDSAPVFRRRGRGDRYSEEHLIACLRWLTSNLDANRQAVLSSDEWNVLRDAAIWRAVERGGWIELPSATAIGAGGALGSWPQARVLAGLASEVTVLYGHKGESYSEAELLDAFEACALAIQAIPERLHYERWRLAQLQARRPRNPWSKLPSEATLRIRLPRKHQKWPEVIEVVLERRPHLTRLRAPQFDGAKA